MTQLCYTLDEAAEKLNLSETVLVRLSQYFRVPRAAYEEVGYLSFKGDLTFSDQDIAFFRQVKERLLAGETLEDVKNRIRPEPLQTQARPAAAASGPAQPLPQPKAQAPNVSYHYSEVAQSSQPPQAAPVQPMAMPLKEVEDRAPFEKAAKKEFDRYKSTHRTGLGKVFENMIKEVGSTPSPKRASAVPEYKPLKAKVQTDEDFAPRRETREAKDSILPFRPQRERPNGRAARNQAPVYDDMAEARYEQPAYEQPAYEESSGRGEKLWSKVSKNIEQDEAASWNQIIQQAATRPRTLNSNLKTAAQILKNRALGPAAQNERLPG